MSEIRRLSKYEQKQKQQIVEGLCKIAELTAKLEAHKDFVAARDVTLWAVSRLRKGEIDAEKFTEFLSQEIQARERLIENYLREN